MKTGMTRKSATAFLALLTALAGAACEKKTSEGPQTCCAQPDIPPGVPKFSVVTDDVSGPSDGQKVIMRVGMLQQVKREQLYAAEV